LVGNIIFLRDVYISFMTTKDELTMNI